MKEIPLIGKHSGLHAIVDDEDYEYLSSFSWHGKPHHRTVYAQTRLEWSGKSLLRCMHKVLFPDSVSVDHKDFDGLNNRRYNLRVCSSRENRMNSRPRTGSASGLKGVSWHKRQEKWVASIRVNYRLIHLGSYGSKLEAATAYDKAATLYFGKFAYLNFPHSINTMKEAA